MEVERVFYTIERASDGKFWVGTGSHLKWTSYLHRAKLFGAGDEETMAVQLRAAQRVSDSKLNVREFRFVDWAAGA